MWRFVSFFHNIAGYPLIRPFHLVTTHRNPSYDLPAGATNPIDPNSEEWKQFEVVVGLTNAQEAKNEQMERAKAEKKVVVKEEGGEEG